MKQNGLLLTLLPGFIFGFKHSKLIENDLYSNPFYQVLIGGENFELQDYGKQGPSIGLVYID